MVIIYFHQIMVGLRRIHVDKTTYLCPMKYDHRKGYFLGKLTKATKHLYLAFQFICLFVDTAPASSPCGRHGRTPKPPPPPPPVTLPCAAPPPEPAAGSPRGLRTAAAGQHLPLPFVLAGTAATTGGRSRRRGRLRRRRRPASTAQHHWSVHVLVDADASTPPDGWPRALGHSGQVQTLGV